jgi:enoyl-CoA hydratase
VGTVELDIQGHIAHVVFNRPAARNAMTWTMYQQLHHICQDIQTHAQLKAVVFRGAGGQAFVAGTDIEQFLAFKSGDDGVAYEDKIDAYIQAVASIQIPTIAVIEGWAIGGGLAIATACDFRIASTGAQLGVPIAKTLGNCLSVSNLSRLCTAFGHQRVKRMLLLAELIGAEEALSCGYLHDLVSADQLTERLSALIAQLSHLAPVTQRVSKAGLGRLAQAQALEDADLIRQAYGSHDFAEGVQAFVAKRKPQWKGC